MYCKLAESHTPHGFDYFVNFICIWWPKWCFGLFDLSSIGSQRHYILETHQIWCPSSLTVWDFVTYIFTQIYPNLTSTYYVAMGILKLLICLNLQFGIPHGLGVTDDNIPHPCTHSPNLNTTSLYTVCMVLVTVFLRDTYAHTYFFFIPNLRMLSQSHVIALLTFFASFQFLHAVHLFLPLIIPH